MALRCTPQRAMILLILIFSSLSSQTSPATTPTPTVAGYTIASGPSAARPHYLPTHPANITMSPAQVSAWNSAVSSAEADFTRAYTYTLLKAVVFSAAPTDAQLSLAISGYNWDGILQQHWYQTGVPEAWREKIDVQEAALQTAVDQVLHAESGGGRLGGIEGVREVAVLMGAWLLGMILL